MNSESKKDLLQITLIVALWLIPIIILALPSFHVDVILQVIFGIIGFLISLCYLLKHTIFKKNAKILMVYEILVAVCGLIILA